MPASVVLVHDGPVRLSERTAALREAGHEVAPFDNPMLALAALEDAERAEVLVTRISFPRGKPNGISLAMVARANRPALKIVFTARPEYEMHAAGIGEFLATPVNVTKLIDTVTRLVEESRRGG